MDATGDKELKAQVERYWAEARRWKIIAGLLAGLTGFLGIGLIGMVLYFAYSASVIRSIREAEVERINQEIERQRQQEEQLQRRADE